MKGEGGGAARRPADPTDDLRLQLDKLKLSLAKHAAFLPLPNDRVKEAFVRDVGDLIQLVWMPPNRRSR